MKYLNLYLRSTNEYGEDFYASYSVADLRALVSSVETMFENVDLAPVTSVTACLYPDEAVPYSDDLEAEGVCPFEFGAVLSQSPVVESEHNRIRVGFAEARLSLTQTDAGPKVDCITLSVWRKHANEPAEHTLYDNEWKTP